MDHNHESDNSTRDTRKAYQPLKLVHYGHFQDVVKQFVASDGSQIIDVETDATT